MNNSISNRGFVNDPKFWVLNSETLIRTVPVDLIFQFPMQTKQMVFQISFKLLDIALAALAFAKFLPSQKQVL